MSTKQVSTVVLSALCLVVSASCVAQTREEVAIMTSPPGRPSTQLWLVQSQAKHLVLDGGYQGRLIGLEELTELESVTITFSTASDWAALPEMPLVKRVTVSKAQLPGLDALYVFPNMGQLIVTNTVITEAQPRLDLSRLPSLAFADLSFSRIAQLPEISNVASGSLTYLNLEGSRIAAGSAEAIDALSSIPTVSLARNSIMESESLQIPERLGSEIRDIPPEFQGYYNLRELYSLEEIARISGSNAREP